MALSGSCEIKRLEREKRKAEKYYGEKRETVRERERMDLHLIWAGTGN